jgi:quercetin dioxygenase-like cupin family protein
LIMWWYRPASMITPPPPRQQMGVAVTAGGRHTADTVFGGDEKLLSQTAIGMIAGARLGEHENPGEATMLVVAGASAVISRGPIVGCPPGDVLLRHSISAQPSRRPARVHG